MLETTMNIKHCPWTHAEWKLGRNRNAKLDPIQLDVISMIPWLRRHNMARYQIQCNARENFYTKLKIISHSFVPHISCTLLLVCDTKTKSFWKWLFWTTTKKIPSIPHTLNGNKSKAIKASDVVRNKRCLHWAHTVHFETFIKKLFDICLKEPNGTHIKKCWLLNKWF